MSHGMWGSMPRHHTAMMSGIPAPYNALRNPLPRTRATVERGQVVYDSNCASPAMAQTARAMGRRAKALTRLQATSLGSRKCRWLVGDSLMYWTVAEGGAQFGTAMPAFKDTLSKDDIWAVVAYVQARMPRRAK